MGTLCHVIGVPCDAADNTALLNAGPANPTPESNAELAAANAEKIAEIRARVSTNNEALDAVIATAETNRASALTNSQAIAERRQAILKNYEAIAANRARIAERVGAR
jgi:hypothetical protein